MEVGDPQVGEVTRLHQSVNQRLFNFEFVDSKIANISEENKSIK